METADTVHDRIERAGTELTPTRAALAIGLAAALGFTIVFLQDPMAHDAMHNFRHAAGVTCH